MPPKFWCTAGFRNHRLYIVDKKRVQRLHSQQFHSVVALLTWLWMFELKDEDEELIVIWIFQIKTQSKLRW